MTWGCGTPLSHQLLPISDEIYPKNHGFLPAKEGFGCVCQGSAISSSHQALADPMILRVLSHYQTKLESGTNHGSHETRILLLYPFLILSPTIMEAENYQMKGKNASNNVET